MIVEDEALVAIQIEGVLTDAGYTVVGYSDTMEGSLAIAETSQPDLALCDIRLVNLSGIDVARQLKERGIPSLFVTGNCATSEGADVGIGCLHKPFDGRRLIDAVRVVTAVVNGGVVPELPASMHLFGDPEQSS
ncbi:MAG: response regulator [Sphingomicrobium sp.]